MSDVKHVWLVMYVNSAYDEVVVAAKSSHEKAKRYIENQKEYSNFLIRQIRLD